MTFEADNGDDAVSSIWRHLFFRHRAIPGYYSKIGCVKIHELYPGGIDEDGLLTTRTGLIPIYEWKYDWPGAAERIPAPWDKGFEGGTWSVTQ